MSGPYKHNGAIIYGPTGSPAGIYAGASCAGDWAAQLNAAYAAGRASLGIDPAAVPGLVEACKRWVEAKLASAAEWDKAAHDVVLSTLLGDAVDEAEEAIEAALALAAPGTPAAGMGEG